VSLFFINIGDYCYYHVWCQKFLDWTDFIGFNMFLFPVIFFFSAITYKMRDEVFKSWFKFAVCYLIPYIALTIYLTQDSMAGGGYAIPGGAIIAEILLFFLFIFFVISLCLIISKYKSLRRGQSQLPPQNFPQNFQK